MAVVVVLESVEVVVLVVMYIWPLSLYGSLLNVLIVCRFGQKCQLNKCNVMLVVGLEGGMHIRESY